MELRELQPTQCCPNSLCVLNDGSTVLGDIREIGHKPSNLYTFAVNRKPWMEFRAAGDRLRRDSPGFLVTPVTGKGPCQKPQLLRNAGQVSDSWEAFADPVK